MDYRAEAKTKSERAVKAINARKYDEALYHLADAKRAVEHITNRRTTDLWK
ncbi:hypothetical protein LCGC14_2263470 [marine sediment metagenome]|uniref:Uncharacterized protein n=1 Tax=marine sediment metagenome TaxID=412755 RepID=A0A0F9FBD0_9ZZZZ